MNLIVLFIIIGIVLGIGGVGGYFVYLKTKPKKETWVAKIYQLGEGIKPPVKDKDGNIISNVKLKDLKPFALDIIEKVEKDPGITVYKLQKAKRTVQDIDGDVVDNWGINKKEIAVLLSENNYSLMKKGYDANVGQIIFRPMPISRINMMKGEMAIRKDRLTKEKDILQAITPWIVAGIMGMVLIGIAYVTVQGYVTIAKESSKATIHNDDTMIKLEQMRGGKIPQPVTPGRQEPPKEKSPVVDGGG